MKPLLILAVSATVVFTQVASAEDEDQAKVAPRRAVQPARAAGNRPPQRSVISRGPRVQPNFSGAPVRQQGIRPQPQYGRGIAPVNGLNADALARRQAVITNRNAAAANRAAAAAARRQANPNIVATTPPRQTATDQQSSVNARDVDGQNQQSRHRDRQNGAGQNGNAANTNWRNSGAWSFDEARRHHRHERHERDWWRSRYNRIVLFGGGYYYWDNNYWYPAYGYDRAYSRYDYDGPIYGYNDLAPDQVLTNVQAELRRQGYYRGAIDGQIGPMTRRALASYQRDQGLEVTAAVDEPTLEALGLV